MPHTDPPKTRAEIRYAEMQDRLRRIVARYGWGRELLARNGLGWWLEAERQAADRGWPR